MDVPDFLKGLRHIGSWQIHSWGCRWELTHSQVEQALNKIDVERNVAGISLGGATIFFAVATAGTMVPIVGGATATVLGLYELLKARIKSADQGNGVIVDLPFDYTTASPLGFITKIPLIPQSYSMNLCNIYARK